MKFKPSFYRRYADDIFVLFESSESADSFCEYMSSRHQNINFTVEKEHVDSLSFLEVRICRKKINLSLVFTENQRLVGFSPIEL